MTWNLRHIRYEKSTSGDTLEVGDCFYYNPPADYDFDNDVVGWRWPQYYARDEILSPYYKQHNAGRPPILVFLPGRILFCVDSMCWRTPPGGKTEYYGGWQVSGNLPHHMDTAVEDQIIDNLLSINRELLTVTPSIDIQNTYHGFLQNGVLKDDVAGLKYDERGRVIRK